MTRDLQTAEERLEIDSGLCLFVRSWRPDGPPRGVVVIVHGFNSHSGEYGWVASQLIVSGLAVYAPDLRGRGKSDGERFFVNKFADWVGDIEKVVSLARSREPGVPVFMLGHSAGGVVACIYALEHQSKLAGLVCESFAHEVPAPDFALAVFKGLSHVAPHAHGLRLKNEDDLLNDLDKEVVMHDIKAWVDARIPAAHPVVGGGAAGV
jgi:acylglycerol lipase